MEAGESWNCRLRHVVVANLLVALKSRTVPPMDHNQFWNIIESAKRRHPDDAEAQADAVCDSLKELPADEIIAFDKIYDELRFRAYNWDLWGAAYVMNGGCGDDGFEYFRAWLISRGREVYERALDDPDSLADEFDGSRSLHELEPLFYAPLHAYEARTGEPMPQRDRSFPELAGRQWDVSELDARYPRIAAKFEERYG